MNKKMVSIMVATCLSLCGASCLFAAPLKQMKTVTATIAGDIGMVLKGKAWHPQDEEKQPIYPIVVNGSSYLPVRALADALGVDIRWDEATRTIVIGDETAPDMGEAPEPPAEPPGEELGREGMGPPNGGMDRPNGDRGRPDAGMPNRNGRPGPPIPGSDRPDAAPSPSQGDARTASVTLDTSVSDVTKLPVGDGSYSTSGPKKGAIYVEQLVTNGGGAFKDGEWIDKNAGTFDLTKKAVVDGEVNWKSELEINVAGDKRIITGDRVPDHPTGQFPISKDDDAYGYDRNPNHIKEKMFELTVPANPVPADRPSPLPYGPIGVLLTGSYIFNGLDAQGKDAVAHEVQDSCYGHPERTGQYHYHNLTRCIDDPYTGEHSKLVGYAADGFGIYGKYGGNGELLTDDDLDEYHGHTHMIEWDGKMVEMYHYHATNEYPYTLGAFKGTPSHFQEN